MEIDWEAPETLRLLMIYLELTGELWWKHRPDYMFPAENRAWRPVPNPQAMNANRWNKRWAGTLALNTPSNNLGHLAGRINNRQVWAHRIIWCWMTGAYPEPGFQIDHIDGNPANNRWANLRLVTFSQQMQNSRSVRPRHDLPRGVGLNSKPGIARPYFSQITANGVYAYLGSFETVEEARAAYLKAAEKLQGEHAFHLSRKPK